MFTPADGSLLLAAAALGLSGSWHCAAMCGSLCSSAAHASASVDGPRVIPLVPATQARSTHWGAFLGARSVSYAALGAAVAWAGALLASLQSQSAIPRALWALAHAAALVYGLSLLVAGRQPAWLLAWAPSGRGSPGAWRQWDRGRWALAGLAWGAIPCGLLHSALLLASLGSGPVAGGAVLWVFALASTPGLVAWPLIQAAWSRWHSRHPSAWKPLQLQSALLRVSGLLLASAALWSLFHGIWRVTPDVC